MKQLKYPQAVSRNQEQEQMRPFDFGLLLAHYQSVRLLVSASPNQPANSVFLSQKTSTSQPKLAPAPTSEQARRGKPVEEQEKNRKSTSVVAQQEREHLFFLYFSLRGAIRRFSTMALEPSVTLADFGSIAHCVCPKITKLLHPFSFIKHSLI